jgi:hypothetical protein
LSALAIPRAFRLSSNNRALCARIGIRFDGAERNDVTQYEAGEEGFVVTMKGERLVGRVGPYWRGAPR